MAILQHQDSQSGWLSLIRADLSRLAVLTPHIQLATWADFCDDQQIAHYSLVNQNGLQKLGKQAAKVLECYQNIWIHFRTFQEAIFTDADQIGVAWHMHELPLHQSGLYGCHLCTASFDTYKALCTHIVRRHGLANIVHKYAASNVCRACLKTYHSREQP